MPGTLLGFTVESLSQVGGEIGYRLHQPGEEFRLLRGHIHDRRLYPLNVKGHQTNIKGHYVFTDEGGELRPTVAHEVTREIVEYTAQPEGASWRREED